MGSYLPKSEGSAQASAPTSESAQFSYLAGKQLLGKLFTDDSTMAAIDKLLEHAEKKRSSLLRDTATSILVEPWSCEIVGGQILITLPKNYSNLADNPEFILVLSLIELCPLPVQLSVCNKEVNAIELTVESRAVILGLLTGLYAPPRSFSTNSQTSMLDRTIIALWTYSADVFLSSPGDKGVVSQVVPRKSAGSAIRWLDGQLQKLAVAHPDYKAWPVLVHNLVRLWTQRVLTMTKQLVTQKKVAWTHVQHAALEHKIRKVKGVELEFVVAPLHPSKNAWLTSQERSLCDTAFSNYFNIVREEQEKWNKLSSEEQHSSFKSVVGRIKAAQTARKQVSNSFALSVGARKISYEKLKRQAGVDKKNDKRSISQKYTALVQYLADNKVDNFDKSDADKISPQRVLKRIPYELYKRVDADKVNTLLEQHKKVCATQGVEFPKIETPSDDDYVSEDDNPYNPLAGPSR
jgi:hypothetical protein